METLADFRSAAAVVGGLLALVVAGIVVARLLRYRASRTPPAVTSEPPPGTSDAAYLDSSHIISGVTPVATERVAQSDGGAAPPGDTAAKPGGPDPGSGPRQ